MTLMARLAGAGALLLAAGCGPRPTAPPGAADSLVQVGQDLFDDENYSAARKAFADAVAQAVRVGDKPAQARALTGQGTAERELAMLDSAAARQEQAIAVWRQIGRAAEAGPAYNALGLTRLDQARDQDGIRAPERAVEAATASHDSATLARALGNLALNTPTAATTNGVARPLGGFVRPAVPGPMRDGKETASPTRP